MAAKRVLVHVGTRKTGSTSIQRMLCERREWLRARGVHLVETGVARRRERSNAGLARAIADRSAAAASRAWNRLAEEIAAVEAEWFVVTAEDFASPGIRFRVADRLAALASRGIAEVDVVGYVRPQWQLLESEYAQRATGGRVGASFARFVTETLAAGTHSIVDYGVVFQPFRALLGRRVRVFPLEPSSLPHGLLAHFLELCGVAADAVRGTTSPRANPRWGAKHVEVCRLVRAHLDANGQGGRARDLWGRPEQRLALAALFADDTPFAGFDRAGIRAVEARFAVANAAFARDYGIDASGRLFGDGAVGAGPRPNDARWEDLGRVEQRRLRRYVRRHLGIDLRQVAAADPAAGRPPPRVGPAAEPAARFVRDDPPAENIATAAERRPPSFLIIGAMRAGTTFLHRQLARHPRIGAPCAKEVHYFDFRYLDGRSWYLAHFPPRSACAVTGEASPYYMVHPLAPDRVRDFDPDMKLIAVLRDPVDRALSHWRQTVRNGHESLTFEQALAAEPERIAGQRALLARPPHFHSFEHRHYSYLERGRYGHYLAAWLERFPRTALHVIRAEDMFADPRRTVAEAAAFLGLPPQELPGDGFRARPRKRRYAPLDPALRVRLDAHFRADSERLRELLGMDWRWDRGGGR